MMLDPWTRLRPWLIDLAVLTGAVVVLWVGLAIAHALLRRIVRTAAASTKSQGLRDGLEALLQNMRFAFLLGALGGATALIGLAGWQTWEGHHYPPRARELLASVPDSFWRDLAVHVGVIAVLAVVVAFLVRLAARVLDAMCLKAQAYEGVRANDESVAAFFGSLTRLVRRAAWLLWLLLAGMIVGLPAGAVTVLRLALTIYLTVALGMLATRAIDAVVASLDALSQKYASKKNLLRYYDKLRPLTPALQRTLESMIWVLVGMAIVMQIGGVAELTVWGPRLIRILWVVFLARVLVQVTGLVLEEFLVQRPKLDAEQRKRRRTIVPLLLSILNYAIYFTAGVWILKEVGVDPTPVLAGAGILALAVGLGAQNLINDMVSGFFILFENHFLVGDFIKVGDSEGEVEAIELRTTKIRDVSGRLHIVRNGQIDELVNYSKEYTFAVVEVGVAYESDIDHVLAVLREVGQELDRTQSDVVEPTIVQGLEAFGESELTMRTITRVRPGRHRQVQRDLRSMIKKAFDEADIEIPYARRVMIFQDAEGQTVPPPTTG